MEYVEYMSSRELRERKLQLEEYIRSGYTFIYDDSIVQYDYKVLEDFQEELNQINEEMNKRIGKTMVKISSLAL